MIEKKAIQAEVRVVECLEAIGRIDDYLSRELSEDEVGAVHRHLSRCEQCSHRFAFEHTLRETVRTECLVEAKAPYALRERIHLLLNAEDMKHR